MTLYKVTLEQNNTSRCIVEVQAETSEEANEKAFDKAHNDGGVWVEVYSGDTEFISTVAAVVYNHAYDIGFSIENDNPDGAISPQELIEGLQVRIDSLKLDPDSALECFGYLDSYKDTKALPAQFDWNTAPVICELDGYKWLLGPEAPEEMSWADAMAWCKEQGGELPPREVLLMCYLNELVRLMFKSEWYWSATEVSTIYAWDQDFSNGGQSYNGKGNSLYARAVRRVKVPISIKGEE